MSRIGLPNIDIEFIQKAVSAIDRSERGILAICIYDSHVTSGVEKKVYRYETDITATDYDADNLAAIKRAFLVAVNKVWVIAAPEPVAAADFSAFTATLEGLKFNYVCCLESTVQQAVATYVVNRNARSAGKKYIALVANATTADSKYVINMKNAWVHDVDADAQVNMNLYLPRIASILCNLPMNRSITYYELEDIDYVDESFIDTVNDIDYWINKGYLLLFLDEDVVKVARGVNSLTTFTSTDSEEMRKIIIVESMNIVIEDIYNTFKEYYIGKYKNSYDNQCLFISAVNTYFRQLAKEEILDPNYANQAMVDIEEQRDAWLAVGKTEAADWDDKTVKDMTFRSNIFLAGQVKILDAIEDLKFTIAMV